jgi:hypothetical protein
MPSPVPAFSEMNHFTRSIRAACDVPVPWRRIYCKTGRRTRSNPGRGRLIRTPSTRIYVPALSYWVKKPWRTTIKAGSSHDRLGGRRRGREAGKVHPRTTNSWSASFKAASLPDTIAASTPPLSRAPHRRAVQRVSKNQMRLRAWFEAVYQHSRQSSSTISIQRRMVNCRLERCSPDSSDRTGRPPRENGF